MALCSTANFDEEGFAAAIRDIERLEQLLAQAVQGQQQNATESNDSLPQSGNNEGIAAPSIFNLRGVYHPPGTPTDQQQLAFNAALGVYMPGGGRTGNSGGGGGVLVADGVYGSVSGATIYMPIITVLNHNITAITPTIFSKVQLTVCDNSGNNKILTCIGTLT